MFIDELERLDREQQKFCAPREVKKLIPIDRDSQLDTGYTGRPDTDLPELRAKRKPRDI